MYESFNPGFGVKRMTKANQPVRSACECARECVCVFARARVRVRMRVYALV